MTTHEQNGNRVTFRFKERGSRVVRANLIYSKNGNGRYEEWFRVPAVVVSDNTVTAELPQGTTHYFINLIDENNFLISYPDVPGGNHFSKTHEKFARYAVPAR